MSAEDVIDLLPYFAQGTVVKGFGRGSSELGIPTANFPEDVIRQLPDAFACGVYYGWACVNTLTPVTVHKMVMCIGYNPHYNNTIKTMETHVMHQFESNFYRENLRILVMGYIRPMCAFESKDALIAAMNGDIRHADSSLEKPSQSAFRFHPFLTSAQIDPSVHSLSNVSMISATQAADSIKQEGNISDHHHHHLHHRHLTDAVTTTQQNGDLASGSVNGIHAAARNGINEEEEEEEKGGGIIVGAEDERKISSNWNITSCSDCRRKDGDEGNNINNNNNFHSSVVLMSNDSVKQGSTTSATITTSSSSTSELSVSS